MYQPFLEHLRQELFARFALEALPIPAGLDYQLSERGRQRTTIQSWCYRSAELRKARYTYIDGGEAAQVFNSVIYPAYQYDLPLLGIDLLSFNRKKILVVLDFQPLFRDEAYLSRHIEPMREIYERYSDLAQPFEMKFYDANQYFSRYLLFARVGDPDLVATRVFSAYKDYLDLYWQMLAAAKPLEHPEAVQRVTCAHRDYDQYSAERDPASGLFSSYFGHEWAERFLYKFLFADAVPLAVTP